MKPNRPALMLALLGLSCGCASNGAVLYDFDGDGSLDADDCGPSEETIHPGAEDCVGDGIDQDCDGVDGTDSDGDGYAHSNDEDPNCAGGDDCNDADASVHPGATEIPGNDNDENCDGVDDFDTDGDGSPDSVDCSPEDPTLNDLDEDGDGGVDADGDLHAALSSGGDDCNDTEPSIFVGAPEILDDGIDQDCNGADAVTCVGSYSIDDVDTAADLAVLADCGVVTGLLTIHGTPMTNLNLLSSLTTVGGILAIFDNEFLVDMGGLSNLTTVGADLTINSNYALTNLDISSLTTVGGDLAIGSNYALANLDISSLTTVSGDLSISYTALTNLDIPSSLTTVDGHLSITDNPSLVSLSGPSNLTTVGAGLLIQGNPNLCQSSIDAFATGAGFPTGIGMGNNTGC